MEGLLYEVLQRASTKRVVSFVPCREIGKNRPLGTPAKAEFHSAAGFHPALQAYRIIQFVLSGAFAREVRSTPESRSGLAAHIVGSRILGCPARKYFCEQVRSNRPHRNQTNN
jgi:hypothetical protein